MSILKERLSQQTNSWYALLVTAGKESNIKEKLNNKKEELPVLDMVIPEPIEKRSEERWKYFMGYIFLKVKLDPDLYHEILSQSYIYRFLGSLHNDKKTRQLYYIPQSIPEKQVNNVRNFLFGESIVFDNRLKVGDEVQIISGDLAEIKGKLIDISNNYATLISDTFFNQTIKISIDKIALV